MFPRGIFCVLEIALRVLGGMCESRLRVAGESIPLLFLVPGPFAGGGLTRAPLWRLAVWGGRAWHARRVWNAERVLRSFREGIPFAELCCLRALLIVRFLPCRSLCVGYSFLGAFLFVTAGGIFSAMCIALLSKIEIAAKRQQFWYSLQAVMLAIFNGWIALSLQMV